MTIGTLKSPKTKKSEQYFRDKIEIFIRLFDEHFARLWKSLTRDVTSYWQADCTTDFLGDTFPSPAGVIKKVSNGEAPPRSPTHYPFVYLFTQER